MQKKKTNEDIVLADHKGNINVEKTNDSGHSGVHTNGNKVNGSVNPTVTAKSFYGFKSKEPEKQDERPVLVTANKPTRPQWYWIGSQTLKQWLTLAIKRFEAELPSSKFIEDTSSANNKMDTQNNDEACNDVQEIVPVPDVLEIKPQPSSLNLIQGSNSFNGNAIDATPTLNFFNEDILCPHNDLSPTENKRLVSADAWKMIYANYFEKESQENPTKAFTKESPLCQICMVRERANYSKMYFKVQFKNCILL